jgi:hypothetical protein
MAWISRLSMLQSSIAHGSEPATGGRDGNGEGAALDAGHRCLDDRQVDA